MKLSKVLQVLNSVYDAMDDMEVELFAEGKMYPIVNIEVFEGVCDISGGWVPKGG